MAVKVKILSKQLIIHYKTLSLTPSPTPPSQSLSLPLTNKQHTGVSSLHGKKSQIFQGIKVAWRRQKWRGRASEKFWTVLGVGRKTVPDKGCFNRERPVTKALEFPFCTRLLSLGLEQRVRNEVYTDRQYDRYGGRVPPQKRKAKVAILKRILSLTGRQWSFLRSGVICSGLLLHKTTSAA